MKLNIGKIKVIYFSRKTNALIYDYIIGPGPILGHRNYITASQ
jgi:hypothetical protein